MLCREVRVWLSPYLDDQLEETQARLLQEHLTECDSCQEKLDLMEQIPTALQTDRMLAPRPEFTRLVMQRIIVQKQIGNTRYEASYSQLSVQTGTRPAVSSGYSETTDSVDTDDDEGEPQNQPANIISLFDRRVTRPRSTSDLALRLSSLAAALVLMVGAAVYIAATGPSGTSDASTAAVYGAIKDFSDTLRNGISSPMEILVGLAVASGILIGLWYLVRALRVQEPANRRQNQNSNR